MHVFDATVIYFNITVEIAGRLRLRNGENMKNHRYRMKRLYGHILGKICPGVIAVVSVILIAALIGYYYRKNINMLIQNGIVNATLQQCMGLKYSLSRASESEKDNKINYSRYCADGDNKENEENEENEDNAENTEDDTKDDNGVTNGEQEGETEVINTVENNQEQTTVPGENEKPGNEEPVCRVDVSALTFNYLMSNYYTVAATTRVNEDELNAARLMAYDMSMKQDNTAPQILIYHTHGQEAFADSTKSDSSMTIVAVGEYLTKLLRETYGYNVIHVTDSFDLIDGVLDRSKAYDYAYNRISQVLAENPSVEVVIDLHRDGIDESKHLVTNINGKPTAKIMFFNGMSRLASTGDIGYLYNPNREMNLAMSMQMKVKAMEYYPEFTRRNYLQAYEYNLQLRPKAMLIEAGAQTNTFQEELNAMEPLADILSKILMH